MPACLQCGTSGWFLALTANKLCKSCDYMVGMEVKQRARLIADSEELINASSNLETIVSRCDFILDQLRALIPYQVKGVPTISPLPGDLLASWKQKRDDLIKEHLNKSFEGAKAKSALAASVKSAVSPLAKVLLRVRDYKPKLLTAGAIDALETSIIDLIGATQLKAYLEAARKAEFKGQKKKALDQYYEALYFLRHDEIDDRKQQSFIMEIETKIRELGGEVR